jgi:DNA polymerase III subunit delta'
MVMEIQGMHDVEIVGQEMPIKILENALKSGNIPHSFLFVGPEGVGKFTTARWFTALLNCKSPRSSPRRPCGACPPCRKLDSGNHPDVRIIVPDKKTLHIKIDQIREIQKEASFQPMESPWKVFIIDGAHRMLDGAANCFLKILEEPPPAMISILISPSAHALIPTIMSRCQMVMFSSLSREELAGYLMKRGIEEERARVFAHIAQGSIGKALGMAVREDIWDLRKKTLSLLTILPTIQAREVLLSVDGMTKELEEVELIVAMALSWFRDMLFIKEHVDISLLINVDRTEDLQAQAGQLTVWQLMTSTNYIKEALVQVRAQVYPPLILERLFLSINRVQTAIA